MPPEHLSYVFEKLTDNQRQVLELAAQHMTSKRIARELDISPKTVDHRIDSVRAKCENIARSDLLRHYQAWLLDTGKNPKGFSPIEYSPYFGSKMVQHSEPSYEFGDSFCLDDRQDWDRSPTVLIAGIDITKLGSGARIFAMIGGAVAIMLLMVLVLNAASALSTLIQ